MKKHNVLNLEVEAYEKSLKELSLKLESNVKQLTDAKDQNRTNEEAIQTLNTEIQTITNQLELEKQNSNGKVVRSLFSLTRFSNILFSVHRTSTAKRFAEN